MSLPSTTTRALLRTASSPIAIPLPRFIATLAALPFKDAYMGENKINFYSGAPALNRLSFHRHSTALLTEHLQHRLTVFVPLQNGNPLVRSTTGELALVGWSEAKAVLGDGPYFEPDAEGTTKQLQGARVKGGVPLVFLGTDEKAAADADKTLLVRDPAPALNDAHPPVFALDASGLESDELETLMGGGEREFVDARKAATRFGYWEAGVFAQAKSMIDWNARNKFCAGCGSKTYSLWGGWKLSCETAKNPESACPSLKGLNNYCYPRTDPVIIMAIVSHDGDKILLGRQKAWPQGMYSCLAGFIEPGESFEDAVRREVYEEAGVVVKEVMYHSSQPWPFPANVMVGCFGRADPAQDIRLDLDNELEDARWFSRKEMLAIMADPNGTIGNRHDQSSFFNQDAKGRAASAADIPNFKLPATTAIAGVLTRSWASNEVAGWGGQTEPRL